MKHRSCRELRSNVNGFEEDDEMKKLDSDTAPKRLTLNENKTPIKETFVILRIELTQNQIPHSLARTWISREEGTKVFSKYMGTKGEDSHDSWVSKTHKAVKKANNSVIGYVSSKSHWALSHGHISLRSPQPKSVEKIVSKGIDLFRHKKPLNIELVHQLRLLDNRFIQWRFANARACAVNHTIFLQVWGNFICALNTQAKLRYSMVLTRIEIEREKLEMKLDGIMQSQMKLLKTWRSMKRQYVAAITLLQECLYSVACRVHLLEGAQVDLKLASVSQKRALKLTDSMNSSLSAFLPLADEIAGLLSELAEVVVQEKFLLQEFNDMFHTMCLLQLEESSLRCSLIQLNS
ncbi:QWRF motif-containing protein [Vigna angularis]|uniref:QWRF motif-containing protein n=1 Tax=Phaseolus angularis TaxID=3914 RepID=A0A8T0KEB6_PHAAN|nr:QWRF motif-containing protein 3 [Vigna angularis]KAG2397242.1 QWRF motif-containing protein [Vigna angularis]